MESKNGGYDFGLFKERRRDRAFVKLNCAAIRVRRLLERGESGRIPEPTCAAWKGRGGSRWKGSPISRGRRCPAGFSSFPEDIEGFP
jgi:hypothetical protein